MNYIQSLQAQVEELKSQLAAKNEKLHNFVCFLHADKFVGVDSRGERKDWIAVGDVLNIVRDI